MSNDGFLTLQKNLVGGSHLLPMSAEQYPGATEAVLQRRFLTIVTMKQPTSGAAPSRPNGCSADEQDLLMALFPSLSLIGKRRPQAALCMALSMSA
ncbi:hypothetical protein [Methanoculleus chikugoensis]|uniref:hypothetical protein n=1 Tax=Methanoculleus chikugoensis TaxID=118126 RepID=UPI001C7F2F9D|nr:hypothetical protein [Methanoculleus chikugoensis]